MGETELWLTEEQFAPLSELPDPAIRTRMASTINLMDNTTRGLLGEVLVAQALGGELTAPWDPWDVVLASGTKIEVKTTGRYQAWPQRRISLTTWSIARAAAWQAAEDGYAWDPDQVRRSDWYVFAVHDGVRPGNTDEWTFRPVETKAINLRLSEQLTVGVSTLDRMFSPPALTYDELGRSNLGAARQSG